MEERKVTRAEVEAAFEASQKSECVSNEFRAKVVEKLFPVTVYDRAISFLLQRYPGDASFEDFAHHRFLFNEGVRAVGKLLSGDYVEWKRLLVDEEMRD